MIHNIIGMYISVTLGTEYTWDKEKKQSLAKRICVGKVDPITGKIIPTRGRRKKKKRLPQLVERPVLSFLSKQDSFITVPHICLISFQTIHNPRYISIYILFQYINR